MSQLRGGKAERPLAPYLLGGSAPPPLVSPRRSCEVITGNVY